MDEKIKKVLSELEKCEELEDGFVDFCSVLLDMGVYGCFPEKIGEKFRENLIILKEDSLMHRIALSKIANKYKNI